MKAMVQWSPRTPWLLVALLLLGLMARTTVSSDAARWSPEGKQTPMAAEQASSAQAGGSWRLAALRTQRLLLDRALNVSTAATIHGWVRKAGPLDLRLWHGSYRQERNVRFNRWLLETRFSRKVHKLRRAQAAQAGARAAPALPEPPSIIFPKCHVFVSHRYKFLYVRHPKTASTSILKYFTECNPVDRPRLTPGPACLARLSSRLSAAEVARLFDDYFVFTVVRNPYQRALSSYKFLVSRMVANGGAACREGMSWERYCADPISLGALCHTNPACCVFPSGFFWHHTLEQARCMLTASGGEEAGGDSSGNGSSGGSSEPGWAVDYIARLEHLDEDMAEVFAEIDRRRPQHLPPVSGWRMGWENATPRYCGGAAVVPGGGLWSRGDVWVGEKQVLYSALLPAQRYCRQERYFEGAHDKCMRSLGHYYCRDFDLLYRGAGEAGEANGAGEAAEEDESGAVT